MKLRDIFDADARNLHGEALRMEREGPRRLKRRIGRSPSRRHGLTHGAVGLKLRGTGPAEWTEIPRPDHAYTEYNIASPPFIGGLVSTCFDPRPPGGSISTRGNPKFLASPLSRKISFRKTFVSSLTCEIMHALVRKNRFIFVVAARGGRGDRFGIASNAAAPRGPSRDGAAPIITGRSGRRRTGRGPGLPEARRCYRTGSGCRRRRGSSPPRRPPVRNW